MTASANTSKHESGPAKRVLWLRAMCAGWWAATRNEPVEFTRWLFLRGLGVVYFAAFISLATQIDALWASDGITPISRYLALVAQQPNLNPYLFAPSLFWLSDSDPMLYLAAWGGVAMSAFVAFGLGTRVLLPVLWIIYLSFTHAGPPFIPFQWDSLILDVGLLGWLFSLTSKPSLLFLWLLRWLAFRLMFLNGLVKIMAFDPAYFEQTGWSSPWLAGTALTYHHLTQPLPAWPAWYLHQLPDWIHLPSTWLVLVAELIVPFLIFLGHRARVVAALCFLGLHLAIMVSGSQALYNWLGLLICIPLLNDSLFSPALVKARRCESLYAVLRTWLFRRDCSPAEERKQARPRLAILSFTLCAVVATLLFLLSINTSLFFVSNRMPNAGPFWKSVGESTGVVERAVQSFRLCGAYGAFGHMTRQRREVIILGSADGIEWREYGHRFKPGRIDAAPGWAAPHHPRVDWQLWFIPLGQRHGWLMPILDGLLRNKPNIKRIFPDNPFPDDPPTYVMLGVYEYQFTDWESGRATGNWWFRLRVGATQPMTLSQDQFVPALKRPDAQVPE